MEPVNRIQESLKQYKFNKARLCFLENRAKRMPDTVFQNRNTEKDIEELQYRLHAIENALEILDTMNVRYRRIIDQYYIQNSRMEEVAEGLHVSRSRCYELCREAVICMAEILNWRLLPNPEQPHKLLQSV